MHLMIPFASTLSEGCRQTLGDLQLPNLSRLLARLSAGVCEGGDETTLTPPHERALASAFGMHGADGCLPWAARQALRDGVEVGDDAWGLLTPAHWQLAADHVSLVDPAALQLGEVDSRALLQAVRGLFESEGWRIAWGAPLRWYAAHESLRELPCAAIDRVSGRNVDTWMPPDPRMALVRRLQSEVQMLLYRAPVNDEREARGALAVNSFWLSGCGVWQACAAEAPRVDGRLRSPALNDDWAAWVKAWESLDEGPVAELLTVAQQGAAVRLTLCGERGGVAFDASPRHWAQRLRSLWSAPSPQQVLEPL